MAPGPARRAHQAPGALHPDDAVGRAALAIRAHRRAAGPESEISAGFVLGALAPVLEATP